MNRDNFVEIGTTPTSPGLVGDRKYCPTLLAGVLLTFSYGFEASTISPIEAEKST
jgi:hypothetical protein